MKDNQEKCKSVFVSWFWLVGILTTLSIPVIAVSVSYGNKVASTDHKIEMIEKDISTIERIENKIDTLLRR